MNNIQSLYIVTGTTGGIGGEIARSIALEGKSLVLACRNMAKAEKQRECLVEETGNANIWCVELDLSSFDGVYKFIDEIKAFSIPIAALVNNAGVMTRRSELSVNGYEMDFQVNTFSTALLTMMLIPLMCCGSKIVFTTSVTRDVWKLCDDFPCENNFGQLATYGRSKRAITMFAIALSNVLSDRSICVNCADPGVVNSGMITMGRWFDPLADVFFRPFISSVSKGASSAINAMKSGETGKIFYHNRLKNPSESIMRDSKHVYDDILKIINCSIENLFS